MWTWMNEPTHLTRGADPKWNVLPLQPTTFCSNATQKKKGAVDGSQEFTVDGQCGGIVCDGPTIGEAEVDAKGSAHYRNRGVTGLVQDEWTDFDALY